MSNISEYQNLIELLKQTLEFYANEINYEPDSDMIDKDKGSQARFALQKIREFNTNQTNNLADYIKNIEETLEGNENIDELYRTLIELKRIANENK